MISNQSANKEAGMDAASVSSETFQRFSKEKSLKSYSYWRLRILYSSMIGYAGFYLVRLNFTMAIPSMQKDLDLSKSEIGAVISVAAILYGLGKGFFGILGDRSSARYFMAFGLFFSSIANFFVGLSSTLPLFAFFWALNSCFQSMGWPPCAKLLTHWFSPKELATKWAIWNTSQQIGTAFITILSGFLIQHFGWRYVFYVPSFIGIFISLYLINRLRDTPEAVGLPPIEEHQGFSQRSEEEQEQTSSFQEILMHVLKNRLVWYVSFANFFVYIVRMSVLNWAPTFLREFKGSSLNIATFQSVSFDLAGMFGGVVAGHLSDNYFKGYRGRVGSIFMCLLSLAVLLLCFCPKDWTAFQFVSMSLIGFLVSGPQILVGVAAADFASKKAAGAASGLTGTFGYLGTAVTGYGVGYTVDHMGWNVAFLGIAFSALLACFFFCLIWNYRSKLLDNECNQNETSKMRVIKT